MATATIMPKVHRALSRSVKREPKDTSRIVDDMRKDPIFRLAVGVIRSMASSAVVSFEVDTTDPRTEALASNLQDQWDSSVQRMLEAVEYGRQAFEVICGRDYDINTVEALTPIPFEMSELKIDRETGYRSELIVGRGDDKVSLLPGQYLFTTIDASFLNPFGVSRYRGAPYQVRQQRKDLDRQEKIWYDRYSQGVGVARVPTEVKGGGITGDGSVGEVDVAGEPIDASKAMMDGLDQLKAGGWMMLSSDRDQTGNLIWDLVQFPDIKDGSAIAARRNHLDVAALRSLGIPERALIQEGQTGAYSLAEAHQLVLNDTVEDILRQIVRAYQQQVVDRMVALNACGEITITWKPIGDKSDSQGSELVRSILTSAAPSPLITDGVIDFIKIVESVGLPVGPEAKTALQRIANRISTQQATPSFSLSQLGQSMVDDVIRERRARVFSLGAQIAQRN